MINTNIPFDIRLGTTDDNNFICDSWYKSVKHTYPNQFQTDFGIRHNHSMKSLLKSSVVIIAHLDTDVNEILSYMVYGSWQQKLVIHFAYTKVDARNQGLMKSLIDFANPNKSVVIFTTPTKNENIMTKLSKTMIFDPNIVSYMSIS